jgi:hypothetical protein
VLSHPPPPAVAVKLQLQGLHHLIRHQPRRGVPRRRGGSVVDQHLRRATPELLSLVVLPTGGVDGRQLSVPIRVDGAHGTALAGRRRATQSLRQGMHNMEGPRLCIAPTLDVAAVFFHAKPPAGSLSLASSRPRKIDWLIGFIDGFWMFKEFYTKVVSLSPRQ